ncbi:MAG: hypothetical protein AVDCRST_MAG39-1807 [uncultured Sphingomonadaceae bacterium]|uniref:Uncharacterized protein n=1 Tax=uncultured Sphingomonadaceae bacterium TaxID=169976 RepID=A0A6J4SX73_9SPHN|nr:MAG: hypothetical protein AVDCRST_MAG39-1807 [uncultured Sphingomonadaceae bacterium]
MLAGTWRDRDEQRLFNPRPGRSLPRCPPARKRGASVLHGKHAVAP